MDWDDIYRQLGGLDDISKKLRAFDEVAQRLSKLPLQDFVDRQRAAYESMTRLTEGPLQGYLDRQRELEAAFQNMGSLADRVLAFDEQWKSIAAKLDLDVRRPADLFAALQDTARSPTQSRQPPQTHEDESTTEASDASTVVRPSGETARTEAAGRVMHDARRVLLVARDRKRPLKIRYEALSFYLALVTALLTVLFQFLNDADDDRRTREIVGAVAKVGDALTTEMQRLHSQMSRRNEPARALVRRKAPLRAGQSANSQSVASLQPGQEVRVLRHAGSWLFVEVVMGGGETLLGWVHIENLRLTLQD